MKIAIYQSDVVWENQIVNHKKLERVLQSTDLRNVTLLCLPELFSTGFSMNTKLAESIHGKTVTLLCKLAKQHHLFILGTFLEKNKKGKPKNTALLISPQGIMGNKYSKVHLFSYDNEDQYFQSGFSFNSFSINNLLMNVVICYDLRFPELFRFLMRKKQKPFLFIIPANWPTKRIHHWKILLQARAIENQAFVIGINRVGHSPKNEYCGNSLLVDPLGNILFDAEDKEGIFIVDIDLNMVKDVRTEYPFLADRKVYHYKK